MPQRKKDEPARNRIISSLSLELVGVRENEQCKVFEQFETGIRKGIFSALQDREQTFSVNYIGLDGQQVTGQRPEEHIEISDEWTKWFAEHRQASKYHVRQILEDFTITTEVLRDAPGEFSILAAMRREALLRKERQEKAEEAKAKPVAEHPIETGARTRTKSSITRSLKRLAARESKANIAQNGEHPSSPATSAAEPEPIRPDSDLGSTATVTVTKS